MQTLTGFWIDWVYQSCDVCIKIGFWFEFIRFFLLSLIFIIYYNVFFISILYIMFMAKKYTNFVYMTNPVKKSKSKIIKNYILSSAVKILKS